MLNRVRVRVSLSAPSLYYFIHARIWSGTSLCRVGVFFRRWLLFHSTHPPQYGLSYAGGFGTETSRVEARFQLPDHPILAYQLCSRVSIRSHNLTASRSLLYSITKRSLNNNSTSQSFAASPGKRRKGESPKTYVVPFVVPLPIPFDL